MDGSRSEWNVADLLETIAAVRGDAAMIVEDHRVLSWRDVDERANRLARHLLGVGLVRGDRVAVCTRNTPACLEAYIACCKASLVPFNVNFRYGPDEITYLLENADARAAVVHDEFAATFAEAARRAGTIETTVVVADWSTDDIDDAAAAGRVDHERIVTTGPGERPVTGWQRSPDDLLFQYTGGTTGMPKAVMWRQGDLVTLLAGKDAPPDEDRSGAPADIADRLAPEPRRSCTIAPLIHGTGLLSQLANFFTGGTSVMLGGRGFDPGEAWACVERHRVNVLVIVGDPMARPLLEALEALVRRDASFDLGSLKMITSSGAMFSRPVKEGLLRLLPNVVLLDAFGSSEASGLGVSMSSADDLDATAVFRIGPEAKLLTDDGRMVAPTTGVVGRIAMTGCVPVGYHKDPVKSAETYPVIDGVRYSVPGDYVTVDGEGNLTLLGRGSAVINTGGEKVHPEEIEEILKEHPSVADAACIGVPDPRFGAAVCAVVQTAGPSAGTDVDVDVTVGGDAEAATVDAETLRRHVRERAAGYKVPRHVVFVDDLMRHPNGKLDRTAITERALAAIGDVSAGSPR